MFYILKPSTHIKVNFNFKITPFDVLFYFPRYKNLISLLILNLTALCVVFQSCNVFPLILMLIQPRFNSFTLHIFLKRTAALAFSNFSLVFR